ncbi:hypothetical protein ACFVIM_15735 [Streptomyces sp. NPDC057638]|uniref:hypothetical protein n=1 Tax=Streptomyces sp. NPDC057638 TaxID=3346190 RepID=UPI0036AF6DAF
MSLPTTASTLVTLAEGGEGAVRHASLSPILVGALALAGLLLLLWITTRFNRDR